jgi:hypothetical protein
VEIFFAGPRPTTGLRSSSWKSNNRIVRTIFSGSWPTTGLRSRVLRIPYVTIKCRDWRSPSFSWPRPPTHYNNYISVRTRTTTLHFNSQLTWAVIPTTSRRVVHFMVIPLRTVFSGRRALARFWPRIVRIASSITIIHGNWRSSSFSWPRRPSHYNNYISMRAFVIMLHFNSSQLTWAVIPTTTGIPL